MATCDLGAPGVASLPFLRVEAAEAVRRGPAIRLSARRSRIMERERPRRLSKVVTSNAGTSSISWV